MISRLDSKTQEEGTPSLFLCNRGFYCIKTNPFYAVNSGKRKTFLFGNACSFLFEDVFVDDGEEFVDVVIRQTIEHLRPNLTDADEIGVFED